MQRLNVMGIAALVPLPILLTPIQRHARFQCRDTRSQVWGDLESGMVLFPNQHPELVTSAALMLGSKRRDSHHGCAYNSCAWERRRDAMTKANGGGTI